MKDKSVQQTDTEQSLLQLERLRTLGMLAAGVAHDFNNVLAGVLGHITYLRSILPQSGPHLESLTAIEDGAKKASGMTQQILKFSRADVEHTPERIELNDLVTRTCKFIRAAISPEHHFRYELPPNPLIVLAEEAKLTQVIVNLVINARDALTREGAILVRVSEVADPAILKRIFNGQDLSAGRYCALTVVDNGHGMSPEVLERALEPYFSTKQDKGTGIGLATVNSVVKLFGGAIELQSTVGQGSSISIYLPLCEFSALESAADAGQPALEGGIERVLVVDDESPVRNVLRMSLEHLGYIVDVASSGEEALLKFGDGRRVDLVILDMIMPNMSGEEVFTQLKALSPSVRVLITSGYTSEESIARILGGGGRGFIQKPFTISELSHKVRESLK